MLNFRFAFGMSLFAFCCAAFPSTALPQQESDARRISALETENAPSVDGLLDDPCWQNADWQGGFIQLKPSPGQPARAETRVAVAFDESSIYVAFRCFSPEGPSTNSRITRRDGNMDQDNAVTVYFDTFHTRRDCYYFSTNSLGTRVEGRIGEDGGSNDKRWDCVWRVAAHEDSAGWSAEMAIPVSEIRISSGSDPVWGVNFRRNYPEYYETSFWQRREVAWRVSQSGDLEGLNGFKKRFSASLYPYMVGLDANTPSERRRTIYSSGGTELISGADLRLNLGSAANANLTYNPDFATVEADLEIINLTRYETFFPEKRLYFLEGAELFSTPINVFHSRRIGDIDWGIRNNGRVKDFNYALLSARERASGGKPSSQTTAFRLQRDVLGSSNIGFLAVDRTHSGGYNRVLSTDASIFFNPRVRLSGQFVGSFPSGGEDFTKAYTISLSRDTGLSNASLGYTSIEPGFRDNVNQLGFVQDDDRHFVRSGLGGERWIRKYGIDKINYNQHNNLMWSHSGALRMVDLGGWVGVTFLEKWLVGVARNYVTELFEKRFRNHTGLLEGGWNYQNWNNVNLLYQWGRSFDRDFSRLRLRGNFKPRDNISLSTSYTALSFSPDPNSGGTHLFNLSGDYNFTPDLWFRLVSLYNTRNDRFYVYGLFGWRFAPPFGAVYLAYTRDRFDTFDDLLRPLSGEDNRAFFIKLTVPLTLY